MVKPTLVKAVKKTTQIKSNPAVLLDEQLTLLQGECEVPPINSLPMVTYN